MLARYGFADLAIFTTKIARLAFFGLKNSQFGDFPLKRTVLIISLWFLICRIWHRLVKSGYHQFGYFYNQNHQMYFRGKSPNWLLLKGIENCRYPYLAYLYHVLHAKNKIVVILTMHFRGKSPSWLLLKPKIAKFGDFGNENRQIRKTTHT